MNVNLLYSKHQRISTGHVFIFRVARTRIQPQLCVGINPQGKKIIQFWLYSQLKEYSLSCYPKDGHMSGRNMSVVII
jgi:hypothetical protein